MVFPVAPTTQKSGAFVNWEGRYREFEPSLRGSTQQAGQSDHRVLDALADEMGVYLGMSSVESAREELAALGNWDGKHAASPHVTAVGAAQPAAGEAILTGWRMLLDAGRLQDGEPHRPAPHAHRWCVWRQKLPPRSAPRRRRGDRQLVTWLDHLAAEHH
ncbi:putative nADH-quinone oxidoreductase subunit G [Mycobacterium ulcerans str. Harvey]|uniref:NADH-quinone oxidoreductase subunit G n=1 Tax=Mycobacterium ulcerans str. Harvey TaxID=1299332 RepID=A0ABN0RAF1_MYCUL|nr:putative nADH-quinone oxidoreductase subunit G [Mycobacterium ulcerans str. Harvey]